MCSFLDMILDIKPKKSLILGKRCTFEQNGGHIILETLCLFSAQIMHLLFRDPFDISDVCLSGKSSMVIKVYQWLKNLLLSPGWWLWVTCTHGPVISLDYIVTMSRDVQWFLMGIMLRESLNSIVIISLVFRFIWYHAECSSA